MEAREAYGMVGHSRTVALRALIGLTGVEPDNRTAWIHVGYQGTWEGHPEGPFSLTLADFASCVAEFEARKNPIPVDYEHASLYPNGGPVPAAGFVQGMEVRDGNLWARVEFTTRAADLIKGGEYRYCSGVFRWDAADRMTGEVRACILDSIALTNRPFIDGQKPIALSALVRALVDTRPPQGVREEAARGLEWRREYGRGGTQIGVARARDLSNGVSISERTARRMLAYFTRHARDAEAQGWRPGEDGYPSAGRIAWALWGGDAGYAWARKLVRSFEAQNRAASVVALNVGGRRMMISKEALLAALENIEGEEMSADQLHALIQGVAAMEAAKSPETAAPVEVEVEEAEAEMACGPKMPRREMSDVALAETPAAAEMPPAVEAPADQAAADAGAMMVARLVEATGMDAAALLAAMNSNLDAVAAALKGAPPAAAPMADTAALSVRLLSDQLSAVKGRLAKYEAAEAESKARALSAEVDGLVSSGRILPSARDQWIALAKRDLEGFRALTATLPVVVPMGREASALTPPRGESQALSETVAEDEQFRALTDSYRARWGFDEAAAKRAAKRHLDNATNVPAR